MDADKLPHHIAQLEEKHQLLKQQITDGFTHYLDDVHLGKMKLEKLIVKRQLEEAKTKLKAQQ
jgi:hypothetical protein